MILIGLTADFQKCSKNLHIFRYNRGTRNVGNGAAGGGGLPGVQRVADAAERGGAAADAGVHRGLREDPGAAAPVGNVQDGRHYPRILPGSCGAAILFELF